MRRVAGGLIRGGYCRSHEASVAAPMLHPALRIIALAASLYLPFTLFRCLTPLVTEDEREDQK